MRKNGVVIQLTLFNKKGTPHGEFNEIYLLSIGLSIRHRGSLRGGPLTAVSGIGVTKSLSGFRLAPMIIVEVDTPSPVMSRVARSLLEV